MRPVMAAGCLLASVSLAAAGEYGLNVDNAVAPPCERPLGHTLNSCTAPAVAADFQRYFVEGRPFEISAVRMAVTTSTFFISGASEKDTVWSSLVTLVAADDVQHWDELYRFVCSLPYSSLTKAFQAELKRGGHSATVHSRLLKVNACRMK